MRKNCDDNKIRADQKGDQKLKKAMRKNHDNEIEADQKSDQKRKKAKCGESNSKMDNAFKAVEDMSVVDPVVLNTEAYKIIQKNFINAITEGPTFICDICIEFHFKNNVMVLNPSKYDEHLLKKCSQGKSKLICKTCDRHMSRKKMPAKVQANNLKPCPKVKELDDLCSLELTLVLQVIPFMYIVGKQKGAQHGLKGQCVLVLANLKKVQGITSTLQRTCNDETVISLALKWRLSDTSYVNKQNIRPILVNKALEKLVEINPFFFTMFV